MEMLAFQCGLYSALQDLYAADASSGEGYFEDVQDAEYSGRDGLYDVQIENGNDYYSGVGETGTWQQAGRGQEPAWKDADKVKGPASYSGGERWSPGLDTSSQDDWD